MTVKKNNSGVFLKQRRLENLKFRFVVTKFYFYLLQVRIMHD